MSRRSSTDTIGPWADAHHPQRPVQVALAQGGDLVVEEGERVGARGRGHRIGSATSDGHRVRYRPVHDHFAGVAGPRRGERGLVLADTPKRWVMAGVMSSPDWSMTVILYQVSYISRP